MAFALRNRRAATAGGGDVGATDQRPVRRTGRSRLAAARGAWAVGSVMLLIARLVRLVVAIAVLLIIAAILLRVLGANAGNSIVRDVHDAGRALVGPFNNVFSIKNPKVSIAVNWGLAAVLWLVVGGFIASLISRAAPRGTPPG